jgi:predicted nucleic acid-binding Zn ribbon protein
MAKSPPNEYNYTCDECGAAFTAMEEMTEHYKRDHEPPSS